MTVHRRIFVLALIAFSVAATGQAQAKVVVGQSEKFHTIAEAVAALPETGGEILIRPGTYREVVHVDKPNVRMSGDAKDPTAVTLVYANGAANTCGTFCSPTLFVTGDGFHMDHMTVANDWRTTGKPRTQGVALSITADRAVLRDVRLLGAQDTLLAASPKCAAGATCKAARQYFDHCYIEGEVDFIFGNARAVFHECEIHSIAHEAGGYLTAQSRNAVAEDSGYVFDHCRLTAETGVTNVFLGRPWRDYATVTFLDTQMGEHIAAAGWSEWHKGETDRLKTATYAEFHSTGPGAHAKEREPLSRQLTPDEAKAYRPKAYLAGNDGWNPVER